MDHSWTATVTMANLDRLQVETTDLSEIDVARITPGCKGYYIL
jgi:hypothetical protein